MTLNNRIQKVLKKYTWKLGSECFVFQCLATLYYLPQNTFFANKIIFNMSLLIWTIGFSRRWYSRKCWFQNSSILNKNACQARMKNEVIKEHARDVLPELPYTDEYGTFIKVFIRTAGDTAWISHRRSLVTHPMCVVYSCTYAF